MRVHDNGSPPRAVVFDLDGTLYPRERYVDPTLDVIARGLVELHGLTPAAARDRVAELRRRMAGNWDATSTTGFMIAEGVDPARWSAYRSRHLDIAAGLSRDEELVAAVRRLSGHLPVALLTNNTRTLAGRILAKIGFPDGVFTAVVGAEDTGAQPKPSPAAFGIVLDRLGVGAPGTWSVGDRYDIDVAPLERLGGAGVTVEGPGEIGEAVGLLLSRLGGVAAA
ncbi:HAD family hydrolase [Hamadaea tsunoensis]|uniref:HAD family hydrolase n=1 Tax=Hamadaea tsunoensis TaxID=53368 RepID=UPI0004234D70|nr:HAD family hydrolase [Hamadaea tsunoensis]